jgi:hypothetical protein
MRFPPESNLVHFLAAAEETDAGFCKTNFQQKLVHRHVHHVIGSQIIFE